MSASGPDTYFRVLALLGKSRELWSSWLVVASTILKVGFYTFLFAASSGFRKDKFDIEYRGQGLYSVLRKQGEVGGLPSFRGMSNDKCLLTVAPENRGVVTAK